MMERQLIALDLRPQRLTRPENVLLPGVIIERFGTHPVRQRPLRVVSGSRS